MLDNTKLAQNLKTQLYEIHRSKTPPLEIFQQRLADTEDLFSLLRLAGMEYFYNDMSPSALS